MLNWYYEKIPPLPYYNYTSEEEKVFKALVLKEDIVIGNKGRLYQVRLDLVENSCGTSVNVSISIFPSKIRKKHLRYCFYEHATSPEHLRSLASIILKETKALDINPLELYK